jgi:Flp pilus assembly protein TadG
MKTFSRTASRCDQGSVTSEMAVFVVPFLILMAMFTIFCGRAASAVIDVNAIAAAAARSAANAPSPAAATTAATDAAAAMAAGTTLSCRTGTDTALFRRGGTVTVHVWCTVTLKDLGINGIDTTRTVHAAATEPIDRYRSTA